RFDQLGELQNLEDAIAVQRRAVDLTPDNHPNMPLRLNNLGSFLSECFDRLGELQNLEDAIAAQHRAVDLTPDDHPDMPVRLHNLGHSLSDRFDRLGELQNLEDAIAVQRRAVDLTPDNHPDMPLRLHNLGSFLSKRFNRLGELPNLEDAITAQSRAVDLTPHGHPNMHHRLGDLGNHLIARFSQSGELSNLEAALVAMRRAVEVTPDGHPDKPVRLGNIGHLLHSRFDKMGDLLDLEETVTVSRRVIELTPHGHPLRPGRLSDLGFSLLKWCRHHRDPSQRHFNSAYWCFMDATCETANLPIVRLNAALLCSSMCKDFPRFDISQDMTLRAHKLVLDHIPPFIRLGQSISRRFDQLSEMQIGPAITAAASSAIGAGKLPLALEWLEEGRNVIWNQVTRLRDPLEGLEAHDPALALQLRDISSSLERTGHGFAQDAASSRAALEDEARNHRELATGYEDLVARIRRIEGFENFLRPKSHAELALACQDGPIVVINVDTSRCDALVLCRPENIIHVPLSKFTFKDAENARTLLMKSLRGRNARWCNRERGTTTGNRQRPSLCDDMCKVMKTIWLYVVQPVLTSIKNELAPPSPGRLPHITWCATGPLSALPLHAAGIYDETGNNPRAPRASDLVVSSYTPSLSALLAAQTQRMDPAYIKTPKILLVSQPQTPEQTPLPCTVVEAVRVRNHFPNSTHLEGARATIDAVVDEMTQHDWVHFACHGTQDSRNPTGSAFLLHDGRLELSRMMSLSHARAELAVLSACQTAKGYDELPEEAVHLAAGMLAAGYKSVVATMWSIADADGPVLSDALYAALKRNLESGEGLNVAYALHEAVEKLRDTVGERDLVRWVPFVHFGV
ncbi:CHAT domain-containing protein, partial [Vararia minispora EC-137]